MTTLGPSIEVLGPVEARDRHGGRVELKGPRHREVLARLVAARGRVVPVGTVVEDLWEGAAPKRAVGAVRTFVSDLRRALEPDRRPGSPARILVTAGEGYAVRAADDAVDAWRFESAAQDRHGAGVELLERALSWWRGPAYADFPDAAWARAERARLTELRLGAVEDLARARLAAGHARAAVADLDAHVIEHPWREEGWRLLGLALYRSDRQGDALAVLRRARRTLAEQLGVEPGPTLATLETDVLARAAHLDPARASTVDRVWADTAADWQRSTAVGPRARLSSATTMLRSLALHGGGPATAAARHAAVVAAADELGDPHVTARVIGGYEVPSVWARSDDPVSSAALVATAERVLRAAPDLSASERSRVLTRIAVETRGLPGPRGREAARDAEALARSVDDPALLAHALAGWAVQSFHRCGLATQRHRLAEEILLLTAERDLPTLTVLGHLVPLQARAGLGDLAGAAADASALSIAGRRFDLPQVSVLLAWFEAVRADTEDMPGVEDRYRAAARLLEGADMPGVRDGLLDLALACARLRRGRPPGPVDAPGPYEPWLRPHLLLAAGRAGDAAAAVRDMPEPPPDHLQEVLWCLAGNAARHVGDITTVDRALAALEPAAGEVAGAGSAMLTLGPVEDHLRTLVRARSVLGSTRPDDE